MPENGASDVSEDLYALVVYLHVTCNRDLLDAIIREQLSLSQLRLLEELRRGRRPTIQQAATMLHVSRGGASRIVDALARRGLVARERNDNDYRSRRVQITERGSEVVARLHAARMNKAIAFTDLLTADEREQLHQALKPIRDRIAPYRPAPTPA